MNRFIQIIISFLKRLFMKLSKTDLKTKINKIDRDLRTTMRELESLGRDDNFNDDDRLIIDTMLRSISTGGNLVEYLRNKVEKLVR